MYTQYCPAGIPAVVYTPLAPVSVCVYTELGWSNCRTVTNADCCGVPPVPVTSPLMRPPRSSAMSTLGTCASDTVTSVAVVHDSWLAYASGAIVLASSISVDTQ